MNHRNQHPWRLFEKTLQSVRETEWDTAILPFGATEPHNLHLPYGTDCLEAEFLADILCQDAWEQGARICLLPTIPFGTESNLQQFPLAMNLQPSTLLQVLRDVVETLEKSGFRKLVLLNSHGGNDFKPFLRELYGKSRVQLFLCNWFQMVRDAAAQIFHSPDDHAGEMETSLILAFRPDLVAKHPDGSLSADSGAVRPFRFEALEKGWVSMTRPWHLLTTNSGSGNPHRASAEKGHELIAVVKQRLVPFLVELSQSKVDDSFPFADWPNVQKVDAIKKATR